MTAFAPDDRLSSAAELNQLIISNWHLADYLATAWDYIPDRSQYVVWGVAISDAGDKVLISPELNTIVEGVDISNALVRHETTEWALREFCGLGLDPNSDPRGHRLANRAEHDRVVSLGVDWDTYCQVMDPQVLIEERARVHTTLPPPTWRILNKDPNA